MSPAPHRVEIPKTCWCGALFHRGIKQRLADFNAQECCCKEHQRILDMHRTKGTPLDVDALDDLPEDGPGQISCTSCSHTLKDADLDEPCNRCEDGSEFSRRRKPFIVSEIQAPIS